MSQFARSAYILKETLLKLKANLLSRIVERRGFVFWFSIHKILKTRLTTAIHLMNRHCPMQQKAAFFTILRPESCWFPVFSLGIILALSLLPSIGMGQTTTRVSINSNGGQGNGAHSEPVLSADGRFVAFASDATNLGSIAILVEQGHWSSCS